MSSLSPVNVAAATTRNPDQLPIQPLEQRVKDALRDKPHERVAEQDDASSPAAPSLLPPAPERIADTPQHLLHFQTPAQAESEAVVAPTPLETSNHAALSVIGSEPGESAPGPLPGLPRPADTLIRAALNSALNPSPTRLNTGPEPAVAPSLEAPASQRSGDALALGSAAVSIVRSPALGGDALVDHSPVSLGVVTTAASESTIGKLPTEVIAAPEEQADAVRTAANPVAGLPPPGAAPNSSSSTGAGPAISLHVTSMPPGARPPAVFDAPDTRTAGAEINMTFRSWGDGNSVLARLTPGAVIFTPSNERVGAALQAGRQADAGGARSYRIDAVNDSTSDDAGSGSGRQRRQ